MAEPNHPKTPKPFFDIVKPNKSRPSSTTRPVIIPNRPILQDPMVNAVPSSNEPTTAPTLTDKMPGKMNIQPLESSAEPSVEAAVVVETPNLVVAEASPGEPNAQSPISEHLEKARTEAAENPAPSEPTTPEIAPVTGGPQPSVPADLPVKVAAEAPLRSGAEPIIEAPKDGAQVTENDLADEADAITENDKKMQKLVDEKRYFLPINSQEKRRTKHFIILGIVLILLLAAAWADIALDAGLIHIDGVKPLTHIFSN